MVEALGWTPVLAISILVGYILGALPLADQLSRRHGVDIFSAGTGLAGATNVRRSVGPVSGGLVLVGDTGKGALAVLAPRFMGLDDPWILFPAAAVIVGHWKSIFSGFRGGDGLATLGGAGLAMFPIIGPISTAVGVLVAYGGQRMPYSSLLSIVFWYATLVSLSLTFDGNLTLTLGVGGLAGFVLAYAVVGHRRRRGATDWIDVDELEEIESSSEQAGEQQTVR